MSKRKRAEKLIGKTVVLYDRAYVVDGVDVEYNNMSSNWTEAERVKYAHDMEKCGVKKALWLIGQALLLDAAVQYKFWRKVNSRCRYEFKMQ